MGRNVKVWRGYWRISSKSQREDMSRPQKGSKEKLGENSVTAV